MSWTSDVVEAAGRSPHEGRLDTRRRERAVGNGVAAYPLIPEAMLALRRLQALLVRHKRAAVTLERIATAIGGREHRSVSTRTYHLIETVLALAEALALMIVLSDAFGLPILWAFGWSLPLALSAVVGPAYLAGAAHRSLQARALDLQAESDGLPLDLHDLVGEMPPSRLPGILGAGLAAVFVLAAVAVGFLRASTAGDPSAGLVLTALTALPMCASSLAGWLHSDFFSESVEHLQLRVDEIEGQQIRLLGSLKQLLGAVGARRAYSELEFGAEPEAILRELVDNPSIMGPVAQREVQLAAPRPAKSGNGAGGPEDLAGEVVASGADSARR